MNRAPTDCAQYITGTSGKVLSYNWKGGDQITNTIYTFCIRREAGYCGISYYPASGQTIDTFMTDNNPTAATMLLTVRRLSGHLPPIMASFWG